MTTLKGSDPLRVRVAILDYGMGNLRSVGKALEHVGAEPFLTSDGARVREADAIVLPGVGAMPKAMERVRELKLDRLLRERVEASVPVVGLCMGMQLLFDSTTELGGAEGIGLFEGRVDALEAPGLKLPQIGWNEVHWRRKPPLIEGPGGGPAVFPAERVGDFDTDLAEEFFRAVANAAKLTLHVRVEAGTNAHHMVEAAFKAFARALRAAVELDDRVEGVPSTKGVL